MTVINRRQREQEVRRQLILNSAKQLFENKGFDATTVEEIAATAELGKGTIYSYFHSKEEIYIAILEQGLEILENRMLDAIKKSSGAIDSLYKLYDTFIEYHRERAGFIESLMMQVDRKVLLRLDSMVSGLKHREAAWLEMAGEILRRGVRDGELKPMDVEKTSRIILGMIIGIILETEIERTGGELAEYREALFSLTLEGLKRN